LSRKAQFVADGHTYSFFTIIQTKYAQEALLCGGFLTIPPAFFKD
jgi:hypothetical protein